MGPILWSQCRMLETSLSFSVRTDMPDIEYFRPLIVYLSQPGRTVGVRTRKASTTKSNQNHSLPPGILLVSLLSAFRRPCTALNHQPTGLWPIREVWHGAGPLKTTFVDLFAPGSTESRTNKLGGVLDALTAPIDTIASKEFEDEYQYIQTNSSEFIDVEDPYARTKARSQLTRKQR